MKVSVEFLKIVENFWWFGIISLAAFPLTILILPPLILRLPEDYFSAYKADGFISRKKRWIRICLLILKNTGGLILLIIGIFMLFLPGQGLLTVLAGLSAMNFPGKRKLEIKLVSKRTVFRALNWIRKKGKKADFIYPG